MDAQSNWKVWVSGSTLANVSVVLVGRMTEGAISLEKIKAVLDGAKQSFYDSKPLFASCSEEESEEGGLVWGGLVQGGLVRVLVGDVKPIGYKQDRKREEIASMREDRKRRKQDLDDPAYVPEVPKDGKKSDMTSKKNLQFWVL